MNEKVTDKCNNTTENIIDIIESLGFTTEREIIPGGLRALIDIEVRRCVSDIVTDFYNQAALVPTSDIRYQSILAASGLKETDDISWAAAGSGKIEPVKNEQTNPQS